MTETPDGLPLTIKEVDDPPEGVSQEDYFWDSAKEIARKKIEPIFRAVLRKGGAATEVIIESFWRNMVFYTAMAIEKDKGIDAFASITEEEVNKYWNRKFKDSYQETSFLKAEFLAGELLYEWKPSTYPLSSLRRFFGISVEGEDESEDNELADVAAAPIAQAEARPVRKRKGLKPLAPNGQLRWPSDRINKAAIEALMPGAIMPIEQKDEIVAKLEARGLNLRAKMWAAYPFESKGGDLYGAIGFTQNPGEVIWDMMQKNGALAVKAQFALWARAYAETDARPNEYIEISISQFCDDLGLPRKKRAHTRENKQRAVGVLRALTQLELSAEWQSPKGKAHRLRGPLWQRGAEAEEKDTYGDLFGRCRVDDPSGWEPVGFAYAPGYFFSNQEWRKYNRNVALIGQGILKLGSGNNDKYAVMVGGYLVTCSRMNSYRKTAFRVETLIRKSGLFDVYGEAHPGQMRNMLERSLDRLQDVGVIQSWTPASIDESNSYDDLNNPDVLASLAEPQKWSKAWRKQCILIQWPDNLEQRGEMLQTKRLAHVKRRGRGGKTATEKTA